MVTDKQYKDLLEKYEELNRKYSQMSRDIASIKMNLDLKRTQKPADPYKVRKDVTKYVFMGKQLNKRQLVLAGVKQYISDFSVTSSHELLNVFPNHIQGSLGVIRNIYEAEQYSDATERFFFKDDEVIHLEDGLFVVSKDWTINNVGRFISLMNNYGYDIKVIDRY